MGYNFRLQRWALFDMPWTPELLGALRQRFLVFSQGENSIGREAAMKLCVFLGETEDKAEDKMDDLWKQADENGTVSYEVFEASWTKPAPTIRT